MKTITNNNRLLLLSLFVTLGLSMPWERQAADNSSSATMASEKEETIAGNISGTHKGVKKNKVIHKLTKDLGEHTFRQKNAKGKTTKVTARLTRYIYNSDVKFTSANNAAEAVSTSDMDILDQLFEGNFDYGDQSSDTEIDKVLEEVATSDYCENDKCSKMTTVDIVQNIKNLKKQGNKAKEIKALASYMAKNRIAIKADFDGVAEGTFGCRECETDSDNTYSDSVYVSLSDFINSEKFMANVKKSFDENSKENINAQNEKLELVKDMKKCKVDLNGNKVKGTDSKRQCWIDLMSAYYQEDERLCDSESKCASGANSAFIKIKSWIDSGDKDERLTKIEDVLDALDEDASDYGNIASNDNRYKNIINPLKVKHFNLAQQDDIKETVREFFSDPIGNAELGKELYTEMEFEKLYRASHSTGVSALDRKNFSTLNNAAFNTYCWADQASAQAAYQDSGTSFLGITFRGSAAKYDSATCSKANDRRYPDINFMTGNQVLQSLSTDLTNGYNPQSRIDTSNSTGSRTQYGTTINDLNRTRRTIARPNSNDVNNGRMRNTQVNNGRMRNTQVYNRVNTNTVGNQIDPRTGRPTSLNHQTANNCNYQQGTFFTQSNQWGRNGQCQNPLIMNNNNRARTMNTRLRR